MKLFTKNLIILPYFFAGMIFFSSCEKVIDLELKSAEPILVIEGVVSNQSDNHLVRISKTIPFDQLNNFIGVKGAKVNLKSSAGLSISYVEISEGIYGSPRFKGIPGQTYTLDVLVDGKTYTAKSTMPEPVIPDSIGFKTLSFFGNSNIYPTVFYKDPAKVQNQYRYILKINGKSQSDIVFEDRFTDGNKVSDILIYDGDEDIKSGDILDIEMQSIDRNVFRYFYALSQIGGNNGPPVAPANPVSNFNNGALGIFNACSSFKRSVIVK